MHQFFYEERAFVQGYQWVAGVDEAGRGCLAGPVVSAACILPYPLDIEGIQDSKQLSFKKRQKLYSVLKNHPQVFYGIGIVDSFQIDTTDILKASLAAMSLAIADLPKKPDYLLVDGLISPPVEITAEPIVKGDVLSASIGAASILAKHTRDLLMIKYHKEYPDYHFHKNKGYGTPFHQESLKKYGPCLIHRKTFAPVKELISSNAKEERHFGYKIP